LLKAEDIATRRGKTVEELVGKKVAGVIAETAHATAVLN